jgi:hypothetical protein
MRRRSVLGDAIAIAAARGRLDVDTAPSKANASIVVLALRVGDAVSVATMSMAECRCRALWHATSAYETIRARLGRYVLTAPAGENWWVHASWTVDCYGALHCCPVSFGAAPPTGWNGGSMFDQLFESFRKASESSLQAQQDLFKQWTQQWQTSPLASTGTTTDWLDIQKKWLESAKDAVAKHRALVDSTYRSGIEMIEHAFKVSEAKSPDDYRRLVEELWRKLSDTFKAQSESQFRDMQTATEKWLDKTRSANNTTGAPS